MSKKKITFICKTSIGVVLLSLSLPLAVCLYAQNHHSLFHHTYILFCVLRLCSFSFLSLFFFFFLFCLFFLATSTVGCFTAEVVGALERAAELSLLLWFLDLLLDLVLDLLFFCLLKESLLLLCFQVLRLVFFSATDWSLLLFLVLLLLPLERFVDVFGQNMVFTSHLVCKYY